MNILLFSILFLFQCLLIHAVPCLESSEKDNKEDNGKDKEDKDKEEKNSKEDGNSNGKDKEKTLKIGNLSLPTSQQPGPLVSFGENVIDKGVVQLFLFGDYYQRRNGHFADLIPSALWGVSDQFSIFYNVPVAASYKDKQDRSSGFEDVFIQFEYAFYSLEKRCYVDQATLVCSISFPTGSNRVKPPTGFGAPAYFIGATYNHTAIDWLYFGSIGSLLTTATKRCTKFGCQLLYEFGVGHNIASPKGWIYAWLVEMDGIYISRNRIRGVIDCNSGVNLIFITPSLFISNEKFIFHLGIGGPLYQHLNGDQIKFLYQVIFNLGYTF